MTPLDKIPLHDRKWTIQCATAIRMEVSRLYGTGKELDDAKRLAIERFCFRFTPDHCKAAILDLVCAMGYSDIHKSDRKAMDKLTDDLEIATGVRKPRRPWFFARWFA